MARSRKASQPEGRARRLLAMTVRIPADQAAELEAVAEVDGVPMSEAIRQAIAEHIETRRKDQAFLAQLKASLERNRQVLEKLAR